MECAFVTARMSSTRLPSKCYQVIVDGVSALQIVIRRTKKIGCPIILATTDHGSDDVLADLAIREGVECFRGAVKNKIVRWFDCFKKYDVSSALLVDGDDPTFDFDVGKRALEELKKNESDLVVASPEMTPGFFTYGITRAGINKLVAQATNPSIDTDVITEFIERACLKKAILHPNADETEGHNVRLTIDYPEDVEFYRELYSRVHFLAPGPEVVRVALRYNLQKINWHMQAAFLKNQKQFNERVRTNG